MKAYCHPTRWSKSTLPLLLIALMAAVTACAGPFGRLQSDADVTLQFESNTVPAQYRYYFFGRPNLPYAIIGIRPEYTLDTFVWESVEPNTADFAHKVRFLFSGQFADDAFEPYGSLILDHKGQTMGIWYSRYRATGVVLKAGNALVVYPPKPPEYSDGWGYGPIVAEKTQ